MPLLSYAPVDAELTRKTKEHNEQAHRALSALQDEMSSQQVCVQQVLKELILCNESRPLCLDGHFEAEKARLLSELAAAGGQQSSLMSIVQDYIHTSFWMMAHESRPEVAGGTIGLTSAAAARPAPCHLHAHPTHSAALCAHTGTESGVRLAKYLETDPSGKLEVNRSIANTPKMDHLEMSNP